MCALRFGHAQLPDGTPVNELMWKAEYSTDEDGDVKQPSFVLEATVPVDADGNIAVPKPVDSAAAATEKLLKEMCGDDFTKKEIRDFQGDTAMVEEIGLDQDPDTLRKVLGNFIRVRNTQNISNGVDYMVDVLRRGMPDYGISRKRPTEACCQCAKELFDSSHTMGIGVLRSV